MAASGALVLMVDVGDAAILGAAQQGLRRFGNELCLQPAAGAAGTAGVPAQRAVLGLCNLAQPPQATKPVLQVRCRPGPYQLRDFHAAVGRLQASDRSSVSSATAAAALQQLVGVVAQDAACMAAGPRRAVLYLTDRTDYEPDDFRPMLEVCRGKGVHIEMVFMAAAAAEEGGDAAVEALAAAWGAAETAFPHLTVTVVPSASRLSFDALVSSLQQRWAAPAQLAVSLAFKAPLVGGIRALQLSASPEVRPLAQCVRHAALCPCHRTPAAWAPGAAAICAVTGAALDARQCGRDERTVQVGPQPGGALHLAAPFNIASAGGGGATLNVVYRIKADQANPALLFGVPLLLGAAAPAQRVKVVHDGELADLTQQQLLGLVCSSLSAAGEALLATCTTDLESGAAGLFRLHYLLLPCEPYASRPPALCAKRLACAEELLAPLLGAQVVSLAEAAPPPPAVAEAVAAQLARVPLQARLDPLALSSRCGDTIEMLVRESQPLPKMQMQAAAPPAAPAVAAPPAQAPAPAPVPAPVAAPAAPAARGRRPAAVAATTAMGAGARESGGRGAAAGGKGGKGALEFRRSTRR